MTQAMSAVTNRPVWVDLASADAAGSRDFYSGLFGWEVEVNQDPQYGGYALARIGGKDVAGIGPAQSAEQPTAWSFYVATDDAEATAERVRAAGGSVMAPPFDVGDQGRMAVFQDPAGAFISTWQGTRMGGFGTTGPGSYGWAELNARGIDRAIPFYERVFGWTTRRSPMDGAPDYIEFLVDGESVAGGWEMNPGVPPEVPSYWNVYFNVDDVDGTFRRALDLGAREVIGPQDFPGGRFAIVTDPQGATFGLLRMAAAGGQ